MTIRRTAEFEKFTDHFVDLSPGHTQSFDDVVSFAAQYLSPEEKKALAAFLGQCLDGTHSEEELRALWMNSRARIGMRPVSPFFERLRGDLQSGRL